MDRTRIDELVTKFRNGEISRRGFIRQATALGISAGAAGMLAGSVGAQDATPDASPAAGLPVDGVPASPAAGVGAAPGEVVSIAPISREEFYQLLWEEFPLEEPQVEGGQVIYGETTDIDTMNLLISSDVYSSEVAGNVYEYLVATNPVDGSFVPGLADTWDIEPDGLTYTFKINPNATWQDGQPVTADDVAFSFDITLAEDTLSPRRGAVDLMLDSYTVVDEKTIQFLAKDRFATFLENTVALVAIMPKHIWQDVPAADWGTDPGSTGQDPARVVGSGPFKFVEWVQEDHVTLEKNADYWDPNFVPTIDTFTFRVIPEASAATQALLTGEIDFTDISFAEAPELTENPDLNVVAHDTTNVNWYAANQDPSKTELFVDPKVRQALMYALDRKLLAEQVYNGYAIQADGTQPVLSVAYRPEEINTVYDYNVELANQLMEEAGWVDEDGDGVREKDGVKFEFECLFSEGVATYEQQLPYMQQAWAEIGVNMKPTAVPFTALLDGTDTGNYDMAVFGFQWSIDGGQIDMFGCDFVPPQGFNSMRYCNPEYDELAQAANKELDPEKRVEMLIEASNIVNDEAAAGYLVFRQTIRGSRKTLHNYLPNGYSHLWGISFYWTEVQ
jgi:peptide/nickel transport system substrate-binding protein